MENPCKEPGWCKELQMNITGKAWDIISGKYGEEMKEKVLRKWKGLPEKEAARPVQVVNRPLREGVRPLAEKKKGCGCKK